MAFATTNVKKSIFGNMKVLVGNWSGLAGDAPGTVQVEGGQVYLAYFNALVPNASTQVPAQIGIESAVSGTTGVVTVTVYNQGLVTAGTFIIISV